MKNPLRRTRPAAPATSPRTPRYGVRVETRRRRKPPRDREHEAFLARVVNDWWNRLIAAVFGGKFSEQSEQYLAHQTKRDYVCNTIGQAAW